MTFRIENISKNYGKNIVINDFSYIFNSGLYLITGVNGIGKSTLLKIIARLIYPTNHNYHIDVEKVAILCEKTGFSNIKVFDFLYNVSKINNMNIDVKKEIKKWIIPNKKINALSNGNKQKVGLLMMRFTDANIYLFDEPTNALDNDAIVHFKNMINDLIKDGKIVIISTHNIDIFSDFKYEEIGLKC